MSNIYMKCVCWSYCEFPSFLQVSFRRQIGSALIFCRRDSVQHSTWVDRWRPLTNVFETLDAGQTGKNTRWGPLTKFYTGTLRLEVQTLVFISGRGSQALPYFKTKLRPEKIFRRPSSPLPQGLGDRLPPASLISRSGSGTVFYIQFWTEKVPLSFTFYWQMVPLSLACVQTSPQGGLLYTGYFYIPS